MEMGQTFSINIQQEWRTIYRLYIVATEEREEVKGKTKQKMARRHSKKGGNHLEQESVRQ